MASVGDGMDRGRGAVNALGSKLLSAKRRVSPECDLGQADYDLTPRRSQRAISDRSASTLVE